MKPTPGSVTGTKIVIFKGGPPQWDGTIHGISKTGGGRAERLDEISDSTIVYIRTDRTQEVQIEREKKSGTVIETKIAEVYDFAGYKEDL